MKSKFFALFTAALLMVGASLFAQQPTDSVQVKAEDASAGKNPIVLIETNQGNIIVQLFPDKAPITVENFLQYVQDGFYDGTIFHRVINGFMIQGGGFEPGMVPRKTRNPIKNEAENGLKNKVGTIAMARSRAIDSATAQFFINVSDNDSLDFKGPTAGGYGYCVFGEVIDGMRVVNSIKSVKTERQGVFSDVPSEPIVIKKVSLLRGKKMQKMLKKLV